MFKITDSNRYGVVSYSLQSENDIDLLPKKGLISGSDATLTKGGIMRLWFFTEGNNEEEGVWEELK